METDKILQADVLDIIFDGRNKQYGAYQLRKTYNRRLATALSAMLFACLLVVVGNVLANNNKRNGKKIFDIGGPEITLTPLDDKKDVPPPPPKPQPKIETIKFTVPLLTKAVVDDPPPPADALDNIAIAAVSSPGDSKDVIAPPPEPTGTGAKKELAHIEPIDAGIGPIQIQAQFPGGAEAWLRYLERSLRAELPADNGAPPGEYKVVVSFMVDKDGMLTNVKAENDPGYGAAAEAIRVIQKSGKWIPAVQNGRNVTYRQMQPITFRVSESQ